MRDPITYSLRVEGAHNSGAYYAAIDALADHWLEHARTQAGDLVDGFRAFAEGAYGRARSWRECAFELLVLGTLLHEHADQAADLPAWSSAVLTELVEAQGRLPWAEDAIKALRGLVGGLSGSFVDSVGRYTGTPDPGQTSRIPARKIVADLVEWLRSQGETTQADRLDEWLAYCLSLPVGQAQPLVARSLALADDFAALSAPVLDPFTEHVQSFVTETAPQCTWRYDAALVTRSRLEYHLGMLGTEILNDAFRERFSAAPRKIVIVPPCLRALPDDQCKAVDTPLGAQCQGCTPGCRVHQITQLAAKQGLPVFSIPDDQLAKLCVSSGQAGGAVGVVGLACALRNWSAGWEADRLGLPAQGLLLDWVGCRKHWDSVGRPTDTNLGELKSIAER